MFFTKISDLWTSFKETSKNIFNSMRDYASIKLFGMPPVFLSALRNNNIKRIDRLLVRDDVINLIRWNYISLIQEPGVSQATALKLLEINAIKDNLEFQNGYALLKHASEQGWTSVMQLLLECPKVKADLSSMIIGHYQTSPGGMTAEVLRLISSATVNNDRATRRSIIIKIARSVPEHTIPIIFNAIFGSRPRAAVSLRNNENTFTYNEQDGLCKGIIPNDVEQIPDSTSNNQVDPKTQESWFGGFTAYFNYRSENDTPKQNETPPIERTWYCPRLWG